MSSTADIIHLELNGIKSELQKVYTRLGEIEVEKLHLDEEVRKLQSRFKRRALDLASLQDEEVAL